MKLRCTTYTPNKKEAIYLFIDEVQKFPEWSRWIRTLFDQHRYRIFITGSTSELSLDSLQSELRGRAINTLVLPFSFKEYLKVKDITYAKYLKAEESGRLTAALSEFFNFGGYPEVAKTKDKELKQRMLSELYATVIQRDMIEKYKIRKTAVFRSFVNSLFGSACRNLSVPAMVGWFSAQGIKISDQTALNYIGYTRSAFLFFLVYPYSRKIREQNTRPKLYASDSGVWGNFRTGQGQETGECSSLSS